MRRVLVAAIVLAVAARLVEPAAATPTLPVVYRAPVPGPIVDPYRPPSTPYGPGNRGVDYATTPGEPVAAPADGVVTFAGAVGGGLHVVILHLDGIRTSLSFMAAVGAVRGQRVVGGQTVGRAGATLHFGARRGEAYLDPTTLLTNTEGGPRSVLVPDGPARPLGVEDEVAGLRTLLSGAMSGATAPSPGPPAVSVGATVGWVGPAAGRLSSRNPQPTAGHPG